MPPGLTDLLTQAVALHQNGQTAEAEALYRRILQIEPDHFDALHLLGLLKHQQNRQAEALELISSALRANPNVAEAFSNYGVVLSRLERHREAVASYDEAIALKPDYADALNNRGNALQDLKRYEEALESYRRAIAFRPDYAEAISNRGNALKALGRHEEALASYERALALKPKHAEALNSRGVVLKELKRQKEALDSYDRALALRPTYVEALNNRGNVLRELKRHEEALASFEKALALKPDYAEALNNRGNVLKALDRRDEALASYDRALAIKPDYPEALSNRGSILNELNRFDEALASHERALALQPDYIAAINNRGNVFTALNRHVDALADYARALELDPGYARGHLNQALMWLVLGDFRAGWNEYEWRWKVAGFPPRQEFSRPLWLGKEPLEGKSILLHAEQGLGDTVQFVRYAKLVAARGAQVLLEVQPELMPLLTGIDGAAKIFARGEKLPPFDLHCPLLSLPLALGTELETIPADTFYLQPPIDRLERWKRRFHSTDVLRIGFCSSGNPTHPNDHNRSIDLARFGPLFSIRGVEFICLQKELGAADAEFLSKHVEVIHLGNELADLADTAVVASMLDLVVSVDTVVAHIAGAMGRPVWLLLPFSPDWRWLLGRNDSPWYPTARLFRQPAPGEWSSVVERVRKELIVLRHKP